MTENRVSIIGLGKVGVTLAASLANAGAKVIGFDLSERVVSDIEQSRFRTNEPDVENLVNSTLHKDLFVTNQIENAVLNSDISFVIVPTPSNSFGGFSNRYVVKACELIAGVLPTKKSRHTIAIVSTMVPGSSEAEIIPAIERVSGLRVCDDFGYCYNPAFIALGEIVRGFTKPDFVLIGESDKESGDCVFNSIKNMLSLNPPVSRMSLTESEITKIASNTHETMRVAFANMLMGICDEVPKCNVDTVTNALAHRMGKRFFKGATPYGGPCWPRDNIALSEFMKLINVPSALPEAVHLSNQQIGKFIIDKIAHLCEPQSAIAVIGLAYKGGTSVTEEAFGLELCEKMLAKGHKVFGWDPLISIESAPFENKKIKLCKTLTETVSSADKIVIANPLLELELFDWENTKNKTVIDCWRCLSKQNQQAISRYVGLGLNSNESVSEWVSNSLGDKYFQLTE